MRAAFAALLLASLAVLFPSLAQDDAPKDTPAKKEFPRVDATDKKALAEHLGKKVTVFGLIKSTKDWDGGANFLNFESSEFMLVCFESEYANFPEGKPAKIYNGKHVEVTGYINEYKKKLQIKLIDPGQINIVDPKKRKADEKQKEKSDPKAKPQEKKEKPKPKKVDPKKYFC